MKLAEFYGGIEIHREDKIIYARFLTPHRVLSTCRSSAGGMHDDLMYIYNHQSCEPAGDHMSARMHKVVESPDEYKKDVSDGYLLPYEKCATLGTAANMNNAAFCHEKFSDSRGRGRLAPAAWSEMQGRAGDPASYYEPQKSSANATSNQVEQVEIPKQGTIKTVRGLILMLLLSAPDF